MAIMSTTNFTCPRSPDQTSNGLRRLSDAVTVLADPPTPIWKQVSSKVAAQDPLVIFKSGRLKFDTRSAANESAYSVDANPPILMHSKQLISHIAYVMKVRSILFRIKVPHTF
ncbi:hypothetical protein GcC1_184018 [Golovinomyces cichoracearum]|uniref:Uncharacterized protein n=1 Tax=Golovinomyces cichoracearum TaxID=62708 RepID=A0A420HLE5_9PEZI|nr:hypothetical protein GcC1_184018 [Golovinomyces cichoracearum]